MSRILKLALCLVLVLSVGTPLAQTDSLRDSEKKLQEELVAKHGEAIGSRVAEGVKQAAEFWRAKDGDAATFEAFIRENFIADQATLDTTFRRFEYTLEQLDGYLHNIQVEFNRQSHLDLGPIQPMDEILAAYDPWAHINDDFF